MLPSSLATSNARSLWERPARTAARNPPEMICHFTVPVRGAASQARSQEREEATGTMQRWDLTGSFLVIDVDRSALSGRSLENELERRFVGGLVLYGLSQFV